MAPVQVDRAAAFDAVWVLGGASTRTVREPELSPAGDRVLLAVRLWHAGKARLLVASGVAPDGHGGLWDGGRETGALWRAVGVPGQAILVVPEPCWTPGTRSGPAPGCGPSAAGSRWRW